MVYTTYSIYRDLGDGLLFYPHYTRNLLTAVKCYLFTHIFPSKVWVNCYLLTLNICWLWTTFLG